MVRLLQMSGSIDESPCMIDFIGQLAEYGACKSGSSRLYLTNSRRIEFVKEAIRGN